MCALVRLDAPASTASVRLDVLVLGWNRQNRTGRKFEQPSHDTADQHADESTASAGPGDDKISVYLASELSDCLSRTTRLKQRKLYRYSVLLEVLDLSGRCRGIAEGPLGRRTVNRFAVTPAGNRTLSHKYVRRLVPVIAVRADTGKDVVESRVPHATPCRAPVGCQKSGLGR